MVPISVGVAVVVVRVVGGDGAGLVLALNTDLLALQLDAVLSGEGFGPRTAAAAARRLHARRRVRRPRVHLEYDVGRVWHQNPRPLLVVALLRDVAFESIKY